MPLKAYEEVIEEPLAFPIGGKVYTPAPISAKAGIFLLRALAGDPDVAKLESRSLWQVVLGDTYDEMIADDVPLDALSRAGYAVLIDWQQDRAAAVLVWESGLDPKARAAMRAAMQSPTSSTSTPSTRPAAATTTRKPGYSTGTKKTPKKAPRKAPRSTGPRSSGTGR